MYEIKKIQVSSMAKLCGLASAFGGLIPMAFYLLFFFLFSGDFQHSSYDLSGLIFIIVIPLITALIGYIYGAAVAFIYNLIVPYVGGIRMEIELIEERGDQKEN